MIGKIAEGIAEGMIKKEAVSFNPLQNIKSLWRSLRIGLSKDPVARTKEYIGKDFGQAGVESANAFEDILKVFGPEAAEQYARSMRNAALGQAAKAGTALAGQAAVPVGIGYGIHAATRDNA